MADKASKAVVIITNKQVIRRGQNMPDIPPEFRRFFGIPEEPAQPLQEQRVLPLPARVVGAHGHRLAHQHQRLGALPVTLRRARLQ